MELICLWASVRVCVTPRLYQQWIGWELCVCRESERELNQITGNTGTRLTPIPTWEEGNERKERAAVKREEAEVMFRWEEGKVRCAVGSAYVITAGLTWVCVSKVAAWSTFLNSFSFFICDALVYCTKKTNKSVWSASVFHNSDMLLSPNWRPSLP